MFFNPVPILISAVGVLLLIKIRAFFIFHPIKTAKLCIKTVSGKGSFLSLSLALAGTLGVGNVLGVAVGLILGGAGSVFWLFTSVIFASALKYSEVVVCSKYSYSGFGMIGAVRESMPRAGGFLSVLYALAALFVALVMGAALQSGTVAECLDLAHSVPSLATSVVLVALVIFAASGGGDIIEKITAVIIPLTTVLYVVLTLSVIIIKRDGIADALRLILNSAFSAEAMGGGALGFLVSQPFREGYSRGILSNEAGAGTSSFAHQRAIGITPEAHGVLGILEVLFDSALLCMLTAFTVLLSVPGFGSYGSGMTLILDAIGSVLGGGFRYFLSFSVLCFAYSTVICWYYYGEKAFSYIFRGKATALYSFLFVCFTAFGFLPGNLTLIAITDGLMAILTTVTLMTLIKNSDGIKAPSEIDNIT